MAKQQPEPKPRPEPRPVVKVVYKGIVAEFKLYADKDGKPYVTLPSGRRGYVTKRRDETYMLVE